MADRKLYDTGWDDCIAYNRDRHNLQQSQVGVGYLCLLLGTIITMLAVTAPGMMWVIGQHVEHWAPLLTLGSGGIILLAAGYVLEKRDRIRYKEREDAHYRKWAARWNELGFNGDE